MSDYKYHHLGIPNDVPRDGEEYLDFAKMYHTNFDDNPYGIEWLRFMPGYTVPDLVHNYPHAAFTVANLDAALEGKKVIIEPTAPSSGVRVAFIDHNGAPVEFMEYDYADYVKDFPQLETERLILRKHHTGDAEALFKLRTNPAIMEFMDTPMMTSQRQAKEMIDRLSKTFIHDQIPIWAICMKDDPEQRMMGYVGYIDHQKKNFRAEICYVLEPEHQGKGLAGEAFNAALKYGFETMELHSIEANISPANAASIKLAEKFNFHKEALYKENWFFDGKFVDTAIYTLLKRNFAGL